MEKEYPDTDYVQLDFFEFLPGYAGGRSLLQKRGPEHFRQLAYLSAGRSEEERKQAAQRGSVTRLRRLYTVPRTEVSEWKTFDTVYRITERVIPWFPHQKRRQKRKRPVYVRIELEFRDLQEDEE